MICELLGPQISSACANQPRTARSWPRRCGAVLLILGLTGGRAPAQGTPFVMNTGGGQVLESQMRMVGTGLSTAPVDFQFSFGFATGQIPQPGVLSDSFTVTLQSLDQKIAAVYATIDAGGLVVAPPSPGAVTLNPATIQVAPIPYPALLPVVAGNAWAYQVNALIPAQFGTGPYTLYFDLFDNQNGVPSQGWFNVNGIAPVPEPSTLALLAGGGLLIWGTRAKKRQGSGSITFSKSSAQSSNNG
jgi:hypothetical protein